MKRRGKVAVSLALLGLFVGVSYSPLSTTETLVSSSAEQAWKAGELALSLSRYQDVAEGRGDLELHRYNQGTVLAALSLEEKQPVKLSAALRSLRGASEQSANPKLKASALYNAGTALLLAGRLSESVPLLRRSIVADPLREDARVNLNLALRKIDREKQQEGGQGGEGRGGAASQGEEAGEKGGGDESASDGGMTGSESEGGASNQGPSKVGREASAGTEAASAGGKEFGSQTAPPPPDAVDDSGLQQKLQALERRSDELRRAGLLRKSNGIAKKFQQAGD